MRQPHKGGCYGPPPQCNIQGAQLPKSRPCHLQLLRLPRCFLLPHFTGVICMGLPMQRTCNTHATLMQHTCNTHATHMQHEHFPCKFPSKVAAGAKIYTFHSKTGVGAANVKSCTLTVNLQVKSSCCMSCCMCVACVLHVRCMAGVQDRAVTLSKWRACHAERQPVHPTTLRNQVKKVSRLSLHVFHLAQPILAHMRPRKQTDTPTHKHPPKLIPMLSLTQCRHHSRVCLQPWVHPIVSFLSPVRFFWFRVHFNCC